MRVLEASARVATSGGDIHHRRWSSHADESAPPIVLVHGLGVASRLWRPTAERLAETFPVMAPDLPGFGESPPQEGRLGHRVPDLAAALGDWMTAVDVERAVVAGVSLGAQVVAEVAREQPDRCAGVVLVSPIVDAERRSWASQLLRWQREQMTQSLHLRAVMLADYLHCGLGRVARTFGDALHRPIEDTVAAVEQPVLVCWGSRDPLVSRDWAEALVGLAPRGRLAAIPGAVHTMSFENPVETSRVISRFVHDHWS